MNFQTKFFQFFKTESKLKIFQNSKNQKKIVLKTKKKCNHSTVILAQKYHKPDKSSRKAEISYRGIMKYAFQFFPTSLKSMHILLPFSVEMIQSLFF